jgi:hypothetical protein
LIVSLWLHNPLDVIYTVVKQLMDVVVKQGVEDVLSFFVCLHKPR